MIAWIQGELKEIAEETCIVAAHGVGYELLCSLGTLAELQGRAGATVSLLVHTHVREDVLQLFGFLKSEEKSTFLALNKVNGIGPKSALNILSGATPSQLAAWIEADDVKSLSKLPKVGKKTAEQMVLTLKGKLMAIDSTGAVSVKTPVVAAHLQIQSALINLGFRPADVEKVVKGLGELEFEDGVRQGLAALTQLSK